MYPNQTTCSYCVFSDDCSPWPPPDFDVNAFVDLKPESDLVIDSWFDGVQICKDQPRSCAWGGNVGWYVYLLASIHGKPTQYFTITATADSGGTINPSGTIRYQEDSTPTFTITANSPNTIKEILVNPDAGPICSRNPDNTIASCTFPPLDRDYTISASFNLPRYPIMATAGPGGTITPSGKVDVPAGGTQRFQIDANPGNTIRNIIVDQGMGGATECGNLIPGETSHTCTFYNVNRMHSIEAVFNIKPIALDQFVYVLMNEQKQITLEGIDDGAIAEYRIDSLPDPAAGIGELVGIGQGDILTSPTVTYQSLGKKGTDSFTFSVKDNEGNW